MKNKAVILVALSSLIISTLRAQDTIPFKHSPTYDFINNDANVIQNIDSLIPFYSKLNQLKSENKSVINILHIGDSHLQADIITGTIRTLLQTQFGNAGLGLSFPGRVARTNESPLIYSSSTGEWETQKITLSQSMTPIGIGGISLKTNGIGNTIKIQSTNPIYSFNRLTLFFQKDFNSYNIIVKDSSGQSLGVAGAFTEEQHSNVSKLRLPYSLNQVQLETAQSLPQQKQFTLYGVSLENTDPGIRYHIIGINGARYRNFSTSRELLQQTRAIDPTLIIISLGTNEAVEHPNVDRKLSSHINNLVSELQRLNPRSIILLTTPVDFYKKRTRRNPGLQTVKNKIIEAAKAKQLPYWNLYEVAGGNHSADQWKKRELLQQDGVHFTKKGYELQGQLLYEAIIKGYNEYVLDRHSKTH